jgi:hypothetical protein
VNTRGGDGDGRNSEPVGAANPRAEDQWAWGIPVLVSRSPDPAAASGTEELTGGVGTG